jgi:hypothetical protein
MSDAVAGNGVHARRFADLIPAEQKGQFFEFSQDGAFEFGAIGGSL